jgi:hypothetical protein
MRVVSSPWSGATWLLPTLLLWCVWLLWVLKVVGTIRAGLLLRLFAESFRLELANLRFGEIEFRLQFEIATDGISVPTLPIPDIALELADLPPKLSIFATQQPSPTSIR